MPKNRRDLIVRRLTLADWYGIYYGYHQIDRQVWLYSGYLMEAREEEDAQVRPGDRHSRKIYRK